GNKNWNHYESILSQDNVINVDSEELEKRKRRAARFGSSLDSYQSEKPKNNNLTSTGKNDDLIYSGKVISNKSDGKNKKTHGKDKDTIIYTMEDVMNFLEVLLLEWRLATILKSSLCDNAITSPSNHSSVSRYFGKQHRLKAQDWFIEKSRPVSLKELGYWNKLFLLMDMEYDNEQQWLVDDTTQKLKELNISDLKEHII
ncbi:11498_t:CDS:2, partial [Acaulospora colombiana]